MICENCRQETFKTRYNVDGYHILECIHCHHLQTDLDQVKILTEDIYSDDYFFGGKYGYPDYTIEKDYLISQGKYYSNKIRKYIIPGYMLDVGAAAGYILKGFIEDGWEGVGLEPNNSMVKYGKKEMGLTMRTGVLEEYDTEERYDLISMIQVIAHIKELNKAFKKISDILNSKGYILIETWDKDSLTAKIMGKYWHEFSPPSTLHYFSKRTLEQFMLAHGFELVTFGKPRKRISGVHARSLLKFKFEENRITKMLIGIEKFIPKKALIPYPSEDLFYALFRKV